jgi:hypothetical protein
VFEKFSLQIKPKKNIYYQTEIDEMGTLKATEQNK